MGAAIARDAPPVVQTFVSALLRTKLELALAGLDASGKTTLVSVLRDPSEHPGPSAPTIGLVVQRARHRGIDLMLWDLGGHHRFREDWSRHVRGCGALLFVVDASDASRFGEARQALQRLLEDPVVSGMPLLVLANKVDLLPPAERAVEEVRGWAALAHELHLDAMDVRSWSVLGVSALRRTNLDKVVRWLVLQAHGAGVPLDADADADDSTGASAAASKVWRLFESLSGWAYRKGSRRWGGKRGGFSALGADASNLGETLLDDESTPYVAAG